MAVSGVTLTKENAPRDPVELLKQGRFGVRRVAKELGLLEDGIADAYFALKPEEQADAVCAKLRELDAGGAVAPSQPVQQVQQQPMQQQVLPSMPVQEQPVQQAPVTRQPRTRAAAAPSTTSGDPAMLLVENVKVVGAQLAALSQQQEAHTKALEENNKLLARQVAGQERICVEIEKISPFLSKAIDVDFGTSTLQLTTLAMVLLFAAPQLGAPEDEILTASLSDAGRIKKLVEAFGNQGKAKG
jgi:hypothetical protein